MLEQLLERATKKNLGLFHFRHSSGTNVANAIAAHTEANAEVSASRLDDFGVELSISGCTGQTPDTSCQVWVPYDWLTPFLAGPPEASLVVLRIAGYIEVKYGQAVLKPLPTSS